MSIHVTAEEKLASYHSAVELLAFITRNYPHLVGKPLKCIVARLSPARYCPDFRSVRWYGQSYTFTAGQARIVQELWKAWEHGTPKMGAAALLEAADMVSDRIAGLFKDHEAWGTMIQTDNKGIYWLNES